MVAASMTARRIYPDLKIRLKRRADGSAAITCERADGTITWQRQEGKIGVVFPAHDMTHYAVETTFGYTDGFFGLVADGWDILDFAKPWPRGPIPDEAREVELLVGLLDTQRRIMADWNAEDLLEQARLYVGSNRDKVALPLLTDEMLERVKSLRSQVFAKWSCIEPGDTLELLFQRNVSRRAPG
ncbi:MAG: hypothetical protein ABIQ55_08345 [Gemmatimonadaceae bacterium]